MQSVQVTESKTGVLTSFADSLGLYKVATLDTNVSEEEAINIAMPYINDYCAQNNRTLKTVNATFSYTTDFNGTRGDSFLVYPVWEVSAQLDGQSNGITGYYTFVWADNGQVLAKGVLGSYQTTKVNAPLGNISFMVIALVAIAPVVVVITYALYKPRKGKATKKTGLKNTGVLLMMIGLCSLLLVEPALAYPSTLLGSQANINNDDELALHNSLTNQIAYWSTNYAGYTTYNNYGSGTYATQIYQAAYDQGYGGSIVFYIGHGNADLMTDNSGGYVWHSNIRAASDPYSVGHHKFAMMWSCDQGDDINKMPRAWLHTASISTNGFTSWDYSGQNYIGFYGTAPYLIIPFTMNNIPQANAGYCLLNAFYYYALVEDFTVNSALEYAVQMLWDTSFTISEWCTGLPDYGRMVSYGTGNIYIGQGLRQLTVSCDPNYGTVNTPSGGWFYGTQVYITATPYSGYQLDYWLVDGQPVYAGNMLGVMMTGDHSVQPVFGPVTYHWLSITNYDMGGGTVYNDIYVDGNYVGSGSAYLQVTGGTHNIDATSPAYETPYGQAWLIYGAGSYNIYSDTSVELWYCPYY